MMKKILQVSVAGLFPLVKDREVDDHYQDKNSRQSNRNPQEADPQKANPQKANPHKAKTKNKLNLVDFLEDLGFLRN